MTVNPNFKVTPLFDVEYIGTDTRRTHYYRPLKESDVWPTELCHYHAMTLIHLQGHLALFSENKT